MFYCKQCDHSMEIPAWDGEQTVCPECGTMVWGDEDERKASEKATKGMRILTKNLEDLGDRKGVPPRETQKNGMEKCGPLWEESGLSGS